MSGAITEARALRWKYGINESPINVARIAGKLGITIESTHNKRAMVYTGEKLILIPNTMGSIEKRETIARLLSYFIEDPGYVRNEVNQDIFAAHILIPNLDQDISDEDLMVKYDVTEAMLKVRKSHNA